MQGMELLRSKMEVDSLRKQLAERDRTVHMLQSRCVSGVSVRSPPRPPPFTRCHPTRSLEDYGLAGPLSRDQQGTGIPRPGSGRPVVLEPLKPAAPASSLAMGSKPSALAERNGHRPMTARAGLGMGPREGS